MEELRSRLNALSQILSGSLNGSSRHSFPAGCSRLVPISAKHLVALHDDASLWLVRTASGELFGDKRRGQGARKLILTSPVAPDSHTLAECRSLSCVAVVASAAISVVTIDTAAASGSVVPVARDLFSRRPGLRVLHVAWHPHADSYLMVLTSDGCLRLYDVVTVSAAQRERIRLRVAISNDAPASFAFGRSDGWDSLAVYVLTEGGSIYVASPIAPSGTRISFASWSLMKRTAEQVLGDAGEKEFCDGTPVSVRTPGSSRNRSRLATPTRSSGMMSTARRDLNFTALDRDEDSDEFEDTADEFSAQEDARQDMNSSGSVHERSDDMGMAWSVRQAQLQLQFLRRAFQRTEAGDMLLMREFKPMPPLFQGPMHIDRDDQEESASMETPQYGQLTVLDCGAHIPMILLRCSLGGDVSVLIGMESVEGQWFASENSGIAANDGELASDEEYMRTALSVAPSLLCFEHIKVPVPELVQLHPVRGKTDSDVLFARTKAEVYSVRLAFLPMMRDEDTLRKCKPSVVSPILSIAPVGTSGNGQAILGLSPVFEQSVGPLAIALTSDFVLEATSPLRWMFDYDVRTLFRSPVFDEAVATHSLISSDLEYGGNDNAFEPSVRILKSRSEVASEIADALEFVQSERNVNSWSVGRGSLGVVGKRDSMGNAIECMETRLAALTGTDEGQYGVGDYLKCIGHLVPRWINEIHRRAVSLERAMDTIDRLYHTKTTESSSLAIKLHRARDLNENLHARVSTIRRILRTKQSSLSPQEKERYLKLKEKKRRLAFLQRRVEEITSAVRAAARDAQGNSATSTWSQSPQTANVIGRLSGSPFSRRRGSSLVHENSPVSPYAKSGKPVDSGLTLLDLQDIKESLSQHSSSIQRATEKLGKLWELFAVM